MSSERFARHRCRCPGARRQDSVSAKYVRRVRRFIRFLTDREVLRRDRLCDPKKIDPRVAAYQDWLRHHRGISERTIDRHGRMITRLLPALGAEPEIYDAALIRRVIIDEAKRSSRPHVKTMTTALRGYLQVPGGDRPMPARARLCGADHSTVAPLGAPALPAGKHGRAGSSPPATSLSRRGFATGLSSFSLRGWVFVPAMSSPCGSVISRGTKGRSVFAAKAGERFDCRCRRIPAMPSSST